jgi:UDP-N-acetylmuramate--alanine ligase
MHYHIMGVGGFGMSALARVLVKRGHTVSGCDMRPNNITAALQTEGVIIQFGHDAAHLQNVDIVLASSAIPENNPEIEAARQYGIPVYERRQAMALLTSGFRTLAIAGTHGKTTTTALLTHVLTATGRDPSAIIGGVMQDTTSNARVGQSDLFVIEADEYGEMFLGLTPEIAVITNIEHDHPDRFPDLDTMIHAFQQFAGQIVPHGALIGGIDSAPVADLIEMRQWQGMATSTYSLQNSDATWFADDIQFDVSGKLQFNIHYENSLLGRATLPLLGTHNAQNALAVCAVADHLSIPAPEVIAALATFPGTQRRSEIMAHVQGITIVNDYAHHPTAVRATLNAWRHVAKRLWAVWEPHTYTRMRALAPEFAIAFSRADVALVLDVYSVREEITPGLSAPNLARMMQEAGHANARYGGTFSDAAATLAREVQAGDVVVIMSAGDGPEVGHLLHQQLEGNA